MESEKLSTIIEEIIKKTNPILFEDSQNYIDFIDNLKFKGIINSKKFLTRSSIEKKKFLIENKIFQKKEKCTFYKPNHDEEFETFEDSFIYKGYNYWLKDEIGYEYYMYQFWKIELIDSNLFIEYRNIENTLNFLLTNQEKIKFLNDGYSKHSKKYIKFIEHDPHPEYLDDNRNFKVGWQDDVLYCSENHLLYYLLDQDLNGKPFKDLKSYDVLKHWSEFSHTKKMMDLHKGLIDELLPYLIKNDIEKLSKNPNGNSLTLNQSLLLLNDILNMKPEVWNYTDRTKKARLISRLLKTDYSNTLKGLTLLEKKGSETTIKFKEDQIYIENLIKDTLCSTYGK